MSMDNQSTQVAFMLRESLKKEWRREVDKKNKHREERLLENMKVVLINNSSQRASQQPRLVKENELVLGAREITKGSCVGTATNPLGEEPDTDRCGLYVDDKYLSTRLMAFGKVFVGAFVHQVCLIGDLVKILRQALSSFISRLTRLVKSVSHEVEWDAAAFGVHNDDFPLFIEFSDVNEIIFKNQCLNITILQLWTKFLNELSIDIGRGSVYVFLEA
ncbi:hypothetical protein GmHk_17G049006 [Glycine max]|nr:hypothetical protein GmHk_17G049006 [Glycine max]